MRKPAFVTVAQVAAFIFIARCLLRVLYSIAGGHSQLIYGRLLGPFWLDAVLAAVSTFCVVRMNEPRPSGLVFASLPISIWLGLTVFSPESFTAWHWIPDGGPREPWGIPPEYSYQFRYTSHEGLIAACVSTVAIELLLTALLITLFRSARVRGFYRCSFPRMRQPDSA